MVSLPDRQFCAVGNIIKLEHIMRSLLSTVDCCILCTSSIRTRTSLERMGLLTKNGLRNPSLFQLEGVHLIRSFVTLCQ